MGACFSACYDHSCGLFTDPGVRVGRDGTRGEVGCYGKRAEEMRVGHGIKELPWYQGIRSSGFLLHRRAQRPQFTQGEVCPPTLRTWSLGFA